MRRALAEIRTEHLQGASQKPRCLGSRDLNVSCGYSCANSASVLDEGGLSHVPAALPLRKVATVGTG